MGIDWSGDFDFERLHLSDEQLEQAAEAGLKPVFDLSQERVPRESDDLADGARIRTDRGGDKTAAITYPGPYARYQHEGVEFHHPTGGQAKFLESSMLDGKDDAMRAAADKIREEL